MPLPPAIIFDWDNTLIDTFPVMHAAHNAVRTAMGETLWTESDARANIRLAAKDAFPLWYPGRVVECEKIYTDYIRMHHLNALRTFDSAADLLAYAYKQDVKLGIVSNKRHEFLRAEVEAVRWAPYFGILVGADDVKGPGKPAPEGVFMALDTLNIEKGQRKTCWYIGDTENDLRTANAAGLIPVFIENNKMSSPEAVALENPGFSFKTCAECLDYLKSVR